MSLASRLLSLPLAKYSRAADVTRDVEHFTWSHFQQNLVFVIDVHQGTQILKVLHDTQLLETIPVQEMISEADQVIYTMQQLRVQVRNEQLPISALTRRPLFALRYNLPGDKVRRLQLKFVTGEDFDTCYNHFAQLGLRMTTSGERPSTANASSNVHHSVNNGSAYPTTTFTEVKTRPSTAAAAPPSYVNPTVPKISSPLARHSITLLPRTEEPTVTARPSSAFAHAPTNIQRRQAASISPRLNPLQPPEYFQRPDSSSSSHERPWSSASREREHNSPLPTIAEDSGFPTVPSSAAMLSTHRQTSEPSLPPRRELPFARSTPPRSSGNDSARPASRSSSHGAMGPPSLRPPSLGRGNSNQGQNSITEVVPSPSHRRTPSFGQNSDREAVALPQPPPSQLGKRNRSTSFDQGSVLEVDDPALPPKTTSWGNTGDTTPKRPKSSYGPPSNGELDMRRFPPAKDTLGQVSPRPKSRSGRPSTGTFDLPPLPTPTIIENPASPARASSSPASCEMSTPTHPPITRPLRTLSAAAQNMRSSSPLEPLHTATAVPEASHHDRVIAEISNDTRASSCDNLASYATRSEEERMTILNDFMMQHIDDDRFLNLVEDVSACWARIGMGL